MMRNLAVELGSLGITINNVAPGAIETPINKSLMNDPDKLNAVLRRQLGEIRLDVLRPHRQRDPLVVLEERHQRGPEGSRRPGDRHGDDDRSVHDSPFQEILLGS